jgi:hypothetical protein
MLVTLLSSLAAFLLLSMALMRARYRLTLWQDAADAMEGR